MSRSTLSRIRLAALVVLSAAAVAGIADATETIAYSYDAHGRLVKVVHTGTVNNNVQVQYTHDDADNRKTVTVTGAPSPAAPRRSEEHTSELQSLIRISYAVFCLKKKKNTTTT